MIGQWWVRLSRHPTWPAAAPGSHIAAEAAAEYPDGVRIARTAWITKKLTEPSSFS